MVVGMTQSSVPALAFSAVVVGQLSGHPAGTPAKSSAASAGIGAGGAMNDTLPEPELKTEPVEVVADTVNDIAPPHLDSRTPLTGTPRGPPGGPLIGAFGFQVA